MKEPKKILDHIRMSKAESGHIIAEHHFADPPPRKGTEPWAGRPAPETHILEPNVKAIGGHVLEHFGVEKEKGAGKAGVVGSTPKEPADGLTTPA